MQIRIVDYFNNPAPTFILLDEDLNPAGNTSTITGIIHYVHHYENILEQFNNNELYGACLTIVGKDGIYYYNHIYCTKDIESVKVGNLVSIRMLGKNLPYPIITVKQSKQFLKDVQLKAYYSFYENKWSDMQLSKEYASTQNNKLITLISNK